MPDTPGIAARVFRPLADAGVNVDMIVQNVSAEGHTDISFTLPKEDVPHAEQILARHRAARSTRPASPVDPDIAKVSLIGAGMKSHPGVAADMFDALADAGVNIEIISTSSIRVSCVVRAGGHRARRAGRARALRARRGAESLARRARESRLVRSRAGRAKRGVTKEGKLMRRLLVGAFAVATVVALGLFPGTARTATLNCSEPTALCTEPVDSIGYGGEYTGHDEPSLLFYSNTAGLGELNALPADAADRSRG